MATKTKKNDDYIPLITEEEIARTVVSVTTSWFLNTKNLAFANYANADRAIPLATSGVKLGTQRLLWSMLVDGVKPGTRPRKSAKVVAAATGAYHPHGQAAMYGALATQARTYGRVQTVEGIGSFGLAPGDEPAADRYTEARLSPLGYAMVAEAGDDAVTTRATYDNENIEPVYLPVPVPVLLCAGADGIGFGWATHTPAHNPREVVAATLAVLDDPMVSIDKLLEIMPGPDWGTGGAVVGGDAGVRSYFESGTGKITVRGTWHVEGKTIVVTEVPPATSVSTLLDGTKSGDNPKPGLRDLARQGAIEGIADVADLTDRKRGLRIEITCKRGADPDQVMENILTDTAMEDTYGANIVALRDDTAPDWWTVRDLITRFIEMRDSVVSTRSAARLAVTEKKIERASAIAAVTLDKEATVKIITAAEDKSAAAAGIAEHFDLTDEQGVWIVEMALHRLTKADSIEAQKRLERLRGEADELRTLIGDDSARRVVIRDELVQAGKLFDDPVYDRRTRLEFDTPAVSGTADEETPEERLVRWRLDTEHMALGEDGEKIEMAHRVWVAMDNGKIKKFAGGGLPKRMTTKPVAPDIDAVHSCGLYTPETQHLLLVTAGTNKGTTAKALRVDTSELRAQGLAGNGVAGIKLLDGDHLVGVFPVTDDDVLLTASDEGFKVTKVSDIPVKGTGAQGVGVHKLRKGEVDTGVMLAQVGPGFSVNGMKVRPVGVAAAAGRTPLDSWEIEAGAPTAV